MITVPPLSHELSEQDWFWRLVIGLALLLGVRLMALATNSTDLFFDEAQYWVWSKDLDFGYYSKPPLIAWAIRAASEVCGDSEFCVRLPSPIFHTLTALFIFATARQLYGAVAGFWAGLGFATLPGVSLSSGIISTDAPLLTFWAMALFGFVALRGGRSWWPVVVLGLGIGLGLNAKYAMAYFVVGLTVLFAWSREDRWLARDWRLYVALAIGIAMILPNINWNLQNGFATFSHTADNAKWHGVLFHPNKALEFFAAQFGVFGPILFAGLLLIALQVLKREPSKHEKLLLSFSLPIIIIVTLQAFISRAHANWAAVSYVAATVLVIGALVQNSDWKWLKSSFLIHLVSLGLLIGATTYARQLVLPNGVSPFARTLGWSQLADRVSKIIQDAEQRGDPIMSIMSDERAVVSELLYYMRNRQPEARAVITAWRGSTRPKDHFQLTRAFQSSKRQPVLFVTLRRHAPEITSRFKFVRKIDEESIKTGAVSTRRVVFFRLDGFTK